MKTLKINYFVTSILAFIVISSIALAMPPIPTKWWGTVSINGSTPTGGIVRAYVNGTFSVSTSIISGLYAIDVPCLSGDNVFLKVFDLTASGTLSCSPGDIFNLNLSVNTLGNGEYCEYNESCSSGECINNFCSPFCGNAYCDSTEDYVTCCVDCGCPSGQICSAGVCSTPSGGGGTYTSGGSSYTSCDENWICTDWSSCLGGTQTRTCTDANNCGTTVNKSVVSQTCTVPCTEDWSCTDWSECVDSLRTRTCTDLKNCGTTVGKPAESEGCVVVSTPPTITGQFLGLTTADWLTAISVGIILALILLFILKRKSKRKR